MVSCHSINDEKARPDGSSLFNLKVPLKTELSRFVTLKAKDPDMAVMEIKRGAVLVGMAGRGQVEELAAMVRRRPTWWWFTSQMFTEAALHGKTNVVDFMVSNGLPLDQPPVCDVLVQLAQAAQGDGSEAVAMTRHLVVSHGLLASQQRHTDWYTALHVACERGLYPLAVCLVALGADVNAVAKDDVMPLHCAEKANEPGPIRAILLKRGARRTWRRDSPPTPPADDDPGADSHAWILETPHPSLTSA